MKNTSLSGFFSSSVYQEHKKRASNFNNSTCVLLIIFTINVLNDITLG